MRRATPWPIYPYGAETRGMKVTWATVATYRWMISRSRGHAVEHAHRHHCGLERLSQAIQARHDVIGRPAPAGIGRAGAVDPGRAQAGPCRRRVARGNRTPGPPQIRT